MIGGIVLIEIASCQNGNAPCLKITGRNVVARGVRPLVDRQDLAISARVECRVAATGEQRDIAGDSDTFKTRNRSHGSEQLFYEALTRPDIGILRRRQTDDTHPTSPLLRSDVLLIETTKTRDQ